MKEALSHQSTDVEMRSARTIATSGVDRKAKIVARNPVVDGHHLCGVCVRYHALA